MHLYTYYHYNSYLPELVLCDVWLVLEERVIVTERLLSAEDSLGATCKEDAVREKDMKGSAIALQ